MAFLDYNKAKREVVVVKHVDVCCALIKDSEGKIFCCKRGPGRAMEGLWEFPGGKIEPNENKEHCIIREIQEELKATIKPIKYLGEFNHTYSDIEKPFNITLYGFLCELVDGELTLTEHIDKCWCKPAELSRLSFAAADLHFVRLINNL